MPDDRAAARLIRKLKDADYRVVPHGQRCKVFAKDGARFVFVPGPKQRTAAKALLNARARLRRELGIDI